MSIYGMLSAFFSPPRSLTPPERLALVETKSQRLCDDLQGKVRQCDYQIRRERFMARDLYARNKPEEAYRHNHAAARINSNRRRFIKTQEGMEERAAMAARLRCQLESAETFRDIDAALAEALPSGSVRELEESAARQSDIALQLENLERECAALNQSPLDDFENEARAEAARMQEELAEEFRNHASTLPHLPSVPGQPAPANTRA